MTDLELRQIFWDEFAAAGLSRDGLLCPSIAVERAIVAAMRRVCPPPPVIESLRDIYGDMDGLREPD